MVYRSNPLRRYIATLRCVHCGTPYVQAAHRNQGKGMGLRCSDGLEAALCPPEHFEIDQGKSLSRDERRERMDRYIVATYEQAKKRGDCPPRLFAEWTRELEIAGLLEVTA